MVTIHRAVLALLILQVYVSAAPRAQSQSQSPEQPVTEITPKADIEKSTSDDPSLLEVSKENSNATENQRQKRFYNHHGYGFPPISPIQYPTYNKRDQASDLGVYGIEDPLSQIQKRLQEIASFARQPPPPRPTPVPIPFPIFFPVIFVPSFGCDCKMDTDTSQATTKPDTRPPTTTPPLDGSTTSPDVVNRWPEMDDDRQNWGLVVNETGEYDGEEFNRPISFDPIVLNTSMSRPVPPVEHGTNQAGSQGGTSATSARPGPPSTPRPSFTGSPRPTNDKASSPVDDSLSLDAPSGPYPPSSALTPREPPTTCDGAVLSCCHQQQVTYDCFSILGCPDPTAYGNPCDSLVILKVIEKYQRFYGVNNG